LLAVTSVDGVNVISGETAGWDQTGYVFNPGERYEITGWRKSDTEVADFVFTPVANSYAQRTGRPANVGVIGVALFRERPPEPYVAPPDISRLQPPAANAAAVPPVGGKLGTGHGERESSVVGHTAFARLQAQPNEIICIHYDSYENLLAMGIIERPRAHPLSAEPFPLSTPQQYVPDPPG
jgi:hypothetical protein